MIPAYDETYLPDAMANLAGAFDYALNDCGLPVGLFMDFFATSEAAALFGRGTPKYVCGMSGEELVAEIMRQTGWARILDMPPAALRAGSTPEYWAGWVLAYCQWARGVRFSDILDVLSLDDIVRLYPTLHEADESRFVDVYDERAAHNRTEGDSRRAGPPLRRYPALHPNVRAAPQRPWQSRRLHRARFGPHAWLPHRRSVGAVGLTAPYFFYSRPIVRAKRQVV